MFHGTHIGGSLSRAASRAGFDVIEFDAERAFDGNRWIRAALWRFGDRRPPRLRRFASEVVASSARHRPSAVIATGMAPLPGSAVERLRALGAHCINYSTDDPWNPAMRARWHLRALREYNAVFTTRRSNIPDLKRIGCPQVHYLPFGYDRAIFASGPLATKDCGPDVLFVGGADRDRISFVREFISTGSDIALVGAYWERVAALRGYALGSKAPGEVARLTAAAKINLCLVRRANRDGHVMRSFEIAALGGCMLVEDTAEHRQIFGPDGEAVVYFRNAQEAGTRTKSLLGDAAERARLSSAVFARISAAQNTYLDRLLAMLEAAAGVRTVA